MNIQARMKSRVAHCDIAHEMSVAAAYVKKKSTDTHSFPCSVLFFAALPCPTLPCLVLPGYDQLLTA
jgi:hypothetical protein